MSLYPCFGAPQMPHFLQNERTEKCVQFFCVYYCQPPVCCVLQKRLHVTLVTPDRRRHRSAPVRQITLFSRIFTYSTNRLLLDLFWLYHGDCYSANDRLHHVFGPRHAAVSAVYEQFRADCVTQLILLVFTALHGMQSRYSDGNSVCPSVRPSVCPSVKRVHCDKTEENSVHIFIPRDR